tara:strand:- start:47 stop:367 length:321 start_codon:yes stop_codon:yes gene_type:complete
MTITYSQFKESYKEAKPIPISSAIQLFIGIIFFIFASFFLVSFLMMFLLVALPFAVLRLRLFKREIQKYGKSNSKYSDHLHVNEQDSSIIEAEYIVMNSASDRVKY